METEDPTQTGDTEAPDSEENVDPAARPTSGSASPPPSKARSPSRPSPSERTRPSWVRCPVHGARCSVR